VRNMLAVIVAAGQGRRMMPLTASSPKPMLKIGNQPLIQRSLRALAKIGIKGVVVVTGYKRELVERHIPCRSLDIIFQFNPFFRETNDLASLWFARPYVERKDFMYLHGDLLYHPEMLRLCIDGPETGMLYDSSAGKNDHEAMKVLVRKGRYVKSSKKLLPRVSTGEFVGICKFSASAGRLLLDEAETLLGQGNVMAYDTEALNRIAADTPIHAIDVAGLPWIEIDSPCDLSRANEKILPRISKNFRL